MNRTILIILLCILISCQQHSKVTINEFETWYENHKTDLVQSKQIGNIYIEVTNEPISALILKQLNGTILNYKMVDSLVKQKGNLEYYTVKIKTNKNIDILDYLDNGQGKKSMLLSYYSFNAQNDFKLVCGKDTLLPLLYDYEPTNDIMPYMTINVAYREPQTNEDRTIIIDSNPLNIGLVNILFNGKTIINIPQIEWKIK